MDPPPQPPARDLSPEELARIQDGLADILRTPEGIEALNRGIDDLIGSALAIDRDFRDVAEGFREAEDILRAEPHHSELVKLRKLWATYRKEYKRLLWLSRDVAGKAHITIHDFVQNILYTLGQSVTRVSFEAKKAELDAYMKKLKDNQQCSQTELVDGFQTLQESIIAFRDKFSKLLEKFKNKEIPHYAEKITAQKALIDEAANPEKWSWMRIAIYGLGGAAVVIGVGAGLLYLFGAIAPAVLCKALAVAATSGSISGGLACYEYMKDGPLERIVKYREASNQLGRVVEVLPVLDRKIVDIAGRLGMFQRVWTIIQSELLGIQNRMEFAEISNDDEMLRRRLADVKLLCEALMPALRRYQTTTNIDPTPPPPPPPYQAVLSVTSSLVQLTVSRADQTGGGILRLS